MHKMQCVWCNFVHFATCALATFALCNTCTSNMCILQHVHFACYNEHSAICNRASKPNQLDGSARQVCKTDQLDELVFSFEALARPERRKVVRCSASRNSKGCAFMRSPINYTPIFPIPSSYLYFYYVFFTIKSVQPIRTKNGIRGLGLSVSLPAHGNQYK